MASSASSTPPITLPPAAYPDIFVDLAVLDTILLTRHETNTFSLLGHALSLLAENPLYALVAPTFRALYDSIPCDSEGDDDELPSTPIATTANTLRLRVIELRDRLEKPCADFAAKVVAAFRKGDVDAFSKAIVAEGLNPNAQFAIITLKVKNVYNSTRTFQTYLSALSQACVKGNDAMSTMLLSRGAYINYNRVLSDGVHILPPILAIECPGILQPEQKRRVQTMLMAAGADPLQTGRSWVLDVDKHVLEENPFWYAVHPTVIPAWADPYALQRLFLLSIMHNDKDPRDALIWDRSDGYDEQQVSMLDQLLELNEALSDKAQTMSDADLKPILNAAIILAHFGVECQDADRGVFLAESENDPSKPITSKLFKAIEAASERRQAAEEAAKAAMLSMLQTSLQGKVDTARIKLIHEYCPYSQFDVVQTCFQQAFGVNYVL